jgi:5-methylcytosine-specific restriction protein A
MPKTHQPREIRAITRQRIWWRDGAHCLRCNALGIANVFPLNRVHIDHIQSGKRGTNADSNQRTLCVMHHILRLDMRHRGMIGGALRSGLIPINWREHLW